MPAFDPVRDALLHSPVDHNPPPPPSRSPLASPSLARRATHLSVLLNDDAAPRAPTASADSSSRPSSSLSHIMAAAPLSAEDKLASSEPLSRRYSGTAQSRSQLQPSGSPVFQHQPQPYRFAESPSPTRYREREREREPPPSYDYQSFPSRPSSSSSTSASTPHNRGNGGSGQFSGGALPGRQTSTSSPSMPPPPTPPMPTSAASTESYATPPPTKSSIPYRPTRRITPAGSVLVPLTPQEIERFKNFRGQGTAKLLAKRKRSESDEEEDQPPLKRHAEDVAVVVEHCACCFSLSVPTHINVVLQTTLDQTSESCSVKSLPSLA